MENEYLYGKKVTLVGTVVNIVLSVVKLCIGYLSGSLGLIADGFHSLSDLASDLVVFVGLSFAEKPIDSDHHYGHGKFETFSAFLVGVFLAFAGFSIAKDSVLLIVDFTRGATLEVPGRAALFAALASIVIKEILFRYTIKAGKKIKSQSIIANAWHHRSDAFSSIGVAVGIGGAILLGGKWAILDPIAGIIVGGILIKEAISIIKENLSQLLEKSLCRDCMEEIGSLLTDIEDCYEPHNIRTRRVGKRVVISLHIRVPENYTIKQGHTIAHRAEDKLRSHFGEDTMVTVHIEPLGNICNN